MYIQKFNLIQQNLNLLLSDHYFNILNKTLIKIRWITLAVVTQSAS